MKTGKSPLLEVRKMDSKDSDLRSSFPVLEKYHEEEPFISCKNDSSMEMMPPKDDANNNAGYNKKVRSNSSMPRRLQVRVYTYKVHIKLSSIL